MNELYRKLKKKAILSVAACVAAATIGTTFAWRTWDLSLTNELKSHSTVVKIEEHVEQTEGIKEVKFTNQGTSSVFLRVSYAEYWEITKQNIKYLLSNTTVENGETIRWATPNFTNNWTDLWQDGKDGWYYYKRILKPNDSTGLILDTVIFNSKIKEKLTDDEGNRTDKYRDYVDGDYHLYFKVESVQCSDGSNTLNSDKVNAHATWTMFKKTATVKDGVVDWSDTEPADLKNSSFGEGEGHGTNQ